MKNNGLKKSFVLFIKGKAKNGPPGIKTLAKI